MGQGAESKKILVSLFEKKSSELLGSQFIFRNETHLTMLTTIDQALVPQCTKEENKARAKKLQQVKTHISNLPDATIMT